MDNYISPFDATVVKKIRDAGAIMLGKTNCDAFGHGASNENSMYGPVHNPYDLNKVALLDRYSFEKETETITGYISEKNKWRLEEFYD